MKGEGCKDPESKQQEKERRNKKLTRDVTIQQKTPTIPLIHVITPIRKMNTMTNKLDLDRYNSTYTPY